MNSLSALSTSIRNISAVVDAWVKPLESSPTPDWEALERAAGILARLMQIEKTIIALDRNPQLADKRYLKQLCDAIARLHALGKVWNQARELEIKLSPLAPLSCGTAALGCAGTSLPPQSAHPQPANNPTPPGNNPTGVDLDPRAAGANSLSATISAPEGRQEVSPGRAQRSPGFSSAAQPHPDSTQGEPRESCSPPATSRSQPDPLKVSPANLYPPFPRSPLYSPKNQKSETQISDPETSCSSCTSCEFSSPPLNPDQSSSSSSPSCECPAPIPNIRAINLLANWHKTLADPDLLNSIHHRIDAIALQLRDFFINIGAPPRHFPHLEHTGIPILTFTYPTKSPPRPSRLACSGCP